MISSGKKDVYFTSENGHFFWYKSGKTIQGASPELIKL